MNSPKILGCVPAPAHGDDHIATVTVLKGTPEFRPLAYTLAMRRVVERAADQPPMKAMSGRAGFGRGGRG